jgi:thioredoxin
MIRFFSTLLVLVCCFSCQSQSNNISSVTTANQQDFKLVPAAFQKTINSTKDAVVMDVRTPDEFNSGGIANAVNVDFRDKYFETRVKDMDVNKIYFVYCLSGGRSGNAADFMRKNGFKNVYELAGGMLAWNKAAMPVTQATNGPINDKINAEEYKSIINSEKIVLIDFYAPWCGPCRQMLPLIEEISKEYEGKAKIIRINIDENKMLTKQLGIDEIPFFKLYKNGEEKGNFIGQLDRASFVRILQ